MNVRTAAGMLAAAWFATASGAGAATYTPDHRPVAAPVQAQQAAADTARYTVRITDNNLIGVTLTNYGFLGNNFVSRSPSFEYPLGSGNEHMVRGGLWIGGKAIDGNGSFVGVSTGAVDGSQGAGSQSATEFTPEGLEISVRSKLPNSKYYNSHSISEQDLVCQYDDKRITQANENNEKHRPMNLVVRQENYSWSFADYQHILFFHYVIRNDGPPLDSLYVGMYQEFASGNKNFYSNWPPSAASSTVGGWFNKKWIAYDADTLRLFREHYCSSLPIPSGCNLNLVPYWVGVKILGSAHGTLPDPRVTMSAWKWSPGNIDRDEDVERYKLMNNGGITGELETSPDFVPPSGDPVSVLSYGPFLQINPGDSITVDFAYVGGSQIEDLQRHANTAQRAFSRNYKVPVPPPSPNLRVVARHQALDVYWDGSPEDAVDSTSVILKDFEGYRVYVGEDRLDLHRIAQVDLAVAPHDTTGFNTGLGSVRLATPVQFDGDTIHYLYKYTIPALRDGFKYFVSVTAYDLGSDEIQPLESGLTQNKTLAVPSPAAGETVGGGGITVFPNPYRVEANWDQGRLVRDHYLWFANLPPRCRIKIFNLAGDLVFDTPFDGASYHGGDARGVYDPRRELDVSAPTLSGRSFAWDLITRAGEAAATGLYLYSVEDAASGKRTIGKFLIVKSDREEF